MTVRVADLMTTLVVTASEDTPFHEVVRLLEAHRISALPVLDAEGRVVGVVSEADLLPRADRPPRLLARELMTSPAITTTVDQPIQAAARLMVDCGVKRLPVVDGRGRPLGVLSRGDVVRVLLRDDWDVESAWRASSG